MAEGTTESPAVGADLLFATELVFGAFSLALLNILDLTLVLGFELFPAFEAVSGSVVSGVSSGGLLWIVDCGAGWSGAGVGDVGRRRSSWSPNRCPFASSQASDSVQLASVKVTEMERGSHPVQDLQCRHSKSHTLS